MDTEDDAQRLFPAARSFAHEAMAARFALYLVEPDETYAAQVAREAFEQLDRLEAELSHYVENSDVSRVNRLPTRRPLIVGSAAFEVIEIAERIREETDGAFDIAVGPPARSGPQRQRATDRGGRSRLQLDKQRRTVEWLEKGPLLDLGGIGKGYALDVLARLLREWDVTGALLESGKSTALANGAPDGGGWPIAIRRPRPPRQTLWKADLHRGAISGSGLRKGAHIIDPRARRPARDHIASWSWAPTAAEADALSTAFLVMSAGETRRYCETHPESLAIAISAEGEVTKVVGRNVSLRLHRAART